MPVLGGRTALLIPTHRLETDLGIGYGENIPWVRKVLEDAVRTVEGVLEDKPVNILFTGFGDSSMTFRVRWWVASYAELRSSTDRVCTAIQEAAEEKGLDMPNPTYALENTIKFDAGDADRISEALGAAMEDIPARPTPNDERGVVGSS